MDKYSIGKYKFIIWREQISLTLGGVERNITELLIFFPWNHCEHWQKRLLESRQI